MLGTHVETVKGRQAPPLLLWVGVLAAAWALASWLVGAAYSALTWAGLGLIIAGIGFAILVNWRSGVYLFLAWLLFEDLARKYLGNNMTIYFGKDVLVGVTYVSFFFALRRGEARRFRPPFWVALMLFFWLGVCQAFNPNSPSIFYGLLGLKLYFYFIPLMFVGYALVRSMKDLDQFLVVNLALAGVIAFLGVVQAIVGLDFLNPAVLAPDLENLGRLIRYAPISGVAVPRPTSVFVSDGRFASYMAMAWVFGFGAAGYLLLRGRKYRKLVFATMAVVFTGVILSGSRGSLMYTLGSSLVLAAAFLWGSPISWARGRRLVKAVTRGFGVAGVALLIAVFFFPEAVGARLAFYSETLNPKSPRFEVVGRTWDYPVANFLRALEYPEWRVGYGIGTASLGGQYVTRILGAPPSRIGVESGFGQLLLELGVPGPLLWLAWSVALVRSGWRVVRELRGTTAFPIGFGILWFAFLLLFPFTFGGLAAYQNFVLNAFLWLLVGVLFRLPELSAQQVAMMVPGRPGNSHDG